METVRFIRLASFRLLIDIYEEMNDENFSHFLQRSNL